MCTGGKAAGVRS